jgi:UDP-glucose 4-epimerase
VTGRPVPYDVVERRPGDAPALVADPTKLMRRLGWEPRYASIEETIATAWRWHESHPQGYPG